MVPHRWTGYVREASNYPPGFETSRCLLPGSNHFHVYPGFGRRIAAHRPDLVHVDEEPYSLVTYQVARVCRRAGVPFVPFTWQNIYKRYPFPFSVMEAYVLRHAAGLLCGNEESAGVFRRKGFAGPIAVIPQFGVEEANFGIRNTHDREGGLSVVFAGRLVPEKGCALLLMALKNHTDMKLTFVGTGSDQEALADRARELGVDSRVVFRDGVSAREVPAVLAIHDVLVLPSVTRPNWKEQFGRVLVEAMATGTPVIGSDSGEIPHVIGDGGLVFREGDVQDLCVKLQNMMEARVRLRFAEKGIARARSFTQEVVASATVAFYREVLSKVSEARPKS